MVIYSEPDFKPQNFEIKDRKNIIRALYQHLGNIGYSYYPSGNILWKVFYNEDFSIYKKVVYNEDGSIRKEIIY